MCGERRLAIACASRSNRFAASDPMHRRRGRRPNELDRGRPCQQAMTCAPDLSHPALSEPLEKTVAAQLSRLSHLVAEREEHARADVRHHDDQQVGKDEDEEKL